MQGPEPIKVEQELVQKRIEAQIGALVVQICVKDAIIETLQAELNALKLGVVQPNGLARPVTGHNEGRKEAQ